jgi:hypothetical protein
MNKHEFDDETLMAFADGELDEATRTSVEAALEDDEQLAERLAVFIDSRLAIAAELKPLINEPVPDALEASVRRMVEQAQGGAGDMPAHGDNVLTFRRKPEPASQPVARPWLMPIAASILALATGFGGYLAGSNGAGVSASFDRQVADMLQREPSGKDIALDGGAVSVHIVASFRDGRGEFCREYEVRRAEEKTATIACRAANGNWGTRLAVTTASAQGYVPASSQDTIDSYLASTEAGQPLSAEEERALLAPGSD